MAKRQYDPDGEFKPITAMYLRGGLSQQQVPASNVKTYRIREHEARATTRQPRTNSPYVFRCG